MDVFKLLKADPEKVGGLLKKLDETAERAAKEEFLQSEPAGAR